MTEPPLKNYLPTERFGALETEFCRRGRTPAIQTRETLLHSNDILGREAARHMNQLIDILCKQFHVALPIYGCVYEDAQAAMNAYAFLFDKTWGCIAVDSALFYAVSASANNLSGSAQFTDYCLFGKTPQLDKSYVTAPRDHQLKWMVTWNGNGHAEHIKLVAAITHVALRFVCLHELAHILNGHLSSGLAGRMSISEVERQSLADVARTLQTLEFDADCFAAHRTVELGLHGKYPSGFADLFGDHTARLRLTLMGICVAVLVIEACELGTVWSCGESSHPPALFRAISTAGTIATIFLTRRPAGIDFTAQEVTKSFWASMLAVDSAITELTGARPDPARLIAFMEVEQSYYEAITARWAEIREALSKAKFGTHNLARADG